MPLALRSLRKVENIVREEMNKVAAMNSSCRSSSQQSFGRDWPLGCTWPRVITHQGPPPARLRITTASEEVVTDIARNEIQSWRQL